MGVVIGAAAALAAVRAEAIRELTPGDRKVVARFATDARREADRIVRLAEKGGSKQSS